MGSGSFGGRALGGSGPSASPALRGLDAAARRLSVHAGRRRPNRTRRGPRSAARFVRRARAPGRSSPLFVRRTPRALALDGRQAGQAAARRPPRAAGDSTRPWRRSAATRPPRGGSRLTTYRLASPRCGWCRGWPRSSASYPDIEIRIDATDRVRRPAAPRTSTSPSAGCRRRPCRASATPADRRRGDAGASARVCCRPAPVRAPADLARWPLLDLDDSAAGHCSG
ncbi:MAG: hypothetical protein MZW92_48805 [Comamonadaceae bacterium]|nr:hypothetical protein [Comamonadaceae bacterium]